MSRAAMAVQQFADEQRRRRPKAAIKRRTHVEDDNDLRDDQASRSLEDTSGEQVGDDIEPDTTDQQPTPAAAETTDETETDMAKKMSAKKPAGRKAVRKTTARKMAAPRQRARRAKMTDMPKSNTKATAETLPAAPSMKLVGGVAARGDRYIELLFEPGGVVRLLPVNLDASETTRVRDRMVEWLTRQL